MQKVWQGDSLQTSFLFKKAFYELLQSQFWDPIFCEKDFSLKIMQKIWQGD